MSFIAWWTERGTLHRSAEQALSTGLPWIQQPLGDLPLSLGPAPQPLAPEHLADLWPMQLRTRSPQNAKVAAALERDFRWIAEGAGRKLHDLARSGLPEAFKVDERARIVSEARTFAAMKAEEAARRISRPPAPPVQPAPPPTPVEQPGGPLAPAPTAAATQPIPIFGEASPALGEPQQVRLNRLLTFVARQEPRIGWAIGNTAEGATLLVTDIAHGWIPPRISLPAGVAVLTPGIRSGPLAELLKPAQVAAEYSPGGAFPETAADMQTLVGSAAHQLPLADNLVERVLQLGANRAGVAPATRCLAPTGESAPSTIYAHVDAARQQLLSDYPFVDERLLGDCMLLAAVVGCVTGEEMLANYHYQWFVTVFGP